MRATESRSSRVTLDVRSLRRSQPPPAASDDAPFGAFIGAFIGILISIPLWVLIAVVILLLRRG
jgi:hypothetical protein